jgi:hypothetical protein
LRLGNFKIVVCRLRLFGIFRRMLAGNRIAASGSDLRLVFLDELLELFDLLRERQRLAREGAMLRLQLGLPQGRGKGLIHFVIGQALGLVRVFSLFGGYGQRRQSLGRLPGAQIDEGLVLPARLRMLPRSCPLRKGRCAMASRVVQRRHRQQNQQRHCTTR